MDITKIQKKISYSDVDYSGHYKISSLFQSLSSIATQDAIKSGLWSIDMMKTYGWIVSKYTMNLEEPIVLDDDIEIYTLTGKNSYVIFPRYFYIKKDERIIGTVSSQWTLLDLEKRQIVAPKRIGITVPMYSAKTPLEKPITINESIDYKYLGDRKVLYSDVDTNSHMNNARYIEWALDTIDYKLFEDHYIDQISINYKKEMKPLSTVKLYYANENNQHYIKGIVEDEVTFIVQVHFL